MSILGSNEHTAMIRESQLGAGQIAAGITALGKANHACTAFYHQAFFGLSIGIERLCKQIIVADHAINNKGVLPKFEDIKNYQHHLHKLVPACDEIGRRFKIEREHAVKPNTEIHDAIIVILAEFAAGTRYSNLNLLTGYQKSTQDPVARWWTEVGVPICDLHYSDEMRQRDEQQAQFATMFMDGIAAVVHTDESGDQISDFETFAKKAGPTAVVQRWGRRYVLQIVRWLVSLAYELSHEGGYGRQITALFCFHEPYSMFNLTDSHMLRKKTFSPQQG